MINTIKHFIFSILASVFLLFTIIEILGGVYILGCAYREYGDTKYILYLIPVVIIGIASFIISNNLFSHKTVEDKTVEDKTELEKLIYVDNSFENDIKNMSEEDIRRKYEVTGYDL